MVHLYIWQKISYIFFSFVAFMICALDTMIAFVFVCYNKLFIRPFKILENTYYVNAYKCPTLLIVFKLTECMRSENKGALNGTKFYFCVSLNVKSCSPFCGRIKKPWKLLGWKNERRDHFFILLCCSEKTLHVKWIVFYFRFQVIKNT